MGSQYTKELANWAEQKTREKRRQDLSAVAFIAVKTRVVEALDAGFTLTTIWEHMVETGRLKCSYETFRRHVHRFITGAENRNGTKNSTPQESSAAATANQPNARNQTEAPSAEPAASRAISPGLPGFQFNAAPNQKDLI